MIVYSILFITLLVGCWAIWLLLNSNNWSRAILALAAASFIHLYGGWIFVSFYVKYVFDVAFVVALINTLFRRRLKMNYPIPGWRIGLNLFFTVLFGALSMLYFTGIGPEPKVAQLQFPFRSGEYFTLQGGKGFPSNFFHAGSGHGKYAVDIVKLNSYGQRSKQIFSKNLEDYFVFGDTVFSPCAGIVMRAVDDNPDNIPPDHTRGPHNLNSVVIESRDYTVFLGHLQNERVFVKAGDTVFAGTPLGLAGNSGFSIEPHLHVQVHAKTVAGLPWYRQEPLYPSFGGKEYLLFQRIRVTLP